MDNGNVFVDPAWMIEKPADGWLHPDQALTVDGGVSFSVGYTGFIPIDWIEEIDPESMTMLPPEEKKRLTRKAIAKVAHYEVVLLPKGEVVSMRDNIMIVSPLSEYLNAIFSASIHGLKLTLEKHGSVMDFSSIESIICATIGDGAFGNYIGYVVKDRFYGLLCHVFNGGDLAFEMLTTIGQLLELYCMSFLEQHDPIPVPLSIAATAGASQSRLPFYMKEKEAGSGLRTQADHAEACSLKMQCAQQMAPDAENPTNVTKEGTLLEQAVEESLAAGETFPSSSLVFSGYLQLRAAAFFTFPPGKVFPRLPGVNLLDPLTGSDTECLSGIPEADAASESGATFTPADAAAEGRL